MTQNLGPLFSNQHNHVFRDEYNCNAFNMGGKPFFFKDHTFIIIKTDFEGYHHYPEAPEEVAFLRNTHRHIFQVEVEIEVDGLNRYLEFFICKRFLNFFLQTKYVEGRVGARSCEMVAEEIVIAFTDRFNTSNISVTVSEDGENAGKVIRRYLQG